MAVFLDRRGFFKALGQGGAAIAGTALFAPEMRLQAAQRSAPAPAGAVPAARGPVVRFTRVSLANGIIPHAGETSMELYHRHPHDPKEEIVQPEDIRLQTRLVMRNHKEVLDWAGLGWKNVVKLTRYQKRMDETPQIDAVLRSYFKDWWPPQITYEINALSSPQARLEIDMWVVPNETLPLVG